LQIIAPAAGRGHDFDSERVVFSSSGVWEPASGMTGESGRADVLVGEHQDTIPAGRRAVAADGDEE
jgi:hypothetical protein